MHSSPAPSTLDDTRTPSGAPTGGSPVGSAPRGLGRIGAWSARRWPIVLIGWVLALLLCVALRGAVGGIFSDNVNLPGTQAHAGQTLLAAHEPTAGGYTGLIVMHVGSGTLSGRRSSVEASLADVRRLPHVLSVSDPLAAGSRALSRDGRTAYASVAFDERPKLLGHPYQATLRAAMRATTADGVQVEYGGSLDELFRPAANDAASEIIGFAVALIVLTVGFGSLVGAVLPLFSALLAVGIGVSLLGLAAAVMTFGTAAPTLSLMIGLGVGIDYSLFLTTRFRQHIADGAAPIDAAGRSVAASGRAVLVAASTVSLALLGLYISGVTFIGQMGLAAVFSVLTAAFAAVTLVPALFGAFGRRIDRFTVGRAVAESGSDNDGWHRYARLVERRAWAFLLGGLACLAVLTVPLFSINLGHVDDGADPTSYTDRVAYDLIASGFGVGANGPFTIVVDLHGATRSSSTIAGTVASALRGTPDVAAATPLRPSPDHRLLVGTLLAESSPQASATRTLFHRLVNVTLPRALRGSGAHGYVTGASAQQQQFRDTVTGSLPYVIATVVALAFLLLLVTFRSIWIPVKAAVLNLLSIGASYGVLVAVFQWGWGASLIGVTERVPIESYVPVIMFAIVFGLSMDYEVFLLSRVKEIWDRTHDNTAAVGGGLAVTGRVISCAAIIMASVFLAFTLSSNVTVKMLAVGLAVSVVVDATIVRLILVPATMKLLGAANWWLPGWLDRRLPHLDPEGPSPDRPRPAVESPA